jgi:predicted transcriptional regulator
MSSWRFLSHHAEVFLCVARRPDARLSEIATEVGITERSVQTIINDLVADGYIDRSRVGRRNHYAVNGRVSVRRRLRRDLTAAALLRLLG